MVDGTTVEGSTGAGNTNRNTTLDPVIELLPDDYSDWSSTVILFNEIDYEITVYAVNVDYGDVYYVFSYPRPRRVRYLVGYIACDFCVYFFGNGDVKSREVNVFDIRDRQLTKKVYPKLKAPKPGPFVFLLDKKLFVLSWATQNLPHFEMLDVDNLQQGWVVLPEPPLPLREICAYHNSSLVDYTKKTLYVRLIGTTQLSDSVLSDLYGFSVQDNMWYNYANLDLRTLSMRTTNLLKASWPSHGAVVVENYLFKFEIFNSATGRKPRLVVRFLEHFIFTDNNAMEQDFLDVIQEEKAVPTNGTLWVDMSGIIPALVCRDLDWVGNLVYLGNTNSRLRFYLVVSYQCESGSGNNHVMTCRFDVLDDVFIVENFNHPIPADCGESSGKSFIENPKCFIQHNVMARGQLACYMLSQR